jgi:hypothetical protein
LNDINVPVLASSVIENSEKTNTTRKTSYTEFKNIKYSVEDYNGLFITERVDALNFRHRVSKPGYFSSWHVAGDPTLIIIRSGVLRIGLRNGEYRDFTSGDMFIAQDYLQENELFDNEIHGHTAELIGNENLSAVHIKLSKSVDTDNA